MIYDSVDKLEEWGERCPELCAALSAARELFSAPFAPGKYVFDGESLYAVSSVYDTEPRECRRFENHRRYIDIQLLVSGEELFDVCLPGTAPSDTDYSVDRDIEFDALGTDFSTVLLRKGDFIVLFPGEWHRPCLDPGDHSRVCEKIVVKVDIERIRNAERKSASGQGKLR